MKTLFTAATLVALYAGATFAGEEINPEAQIREALSQYTSNYGDGAEIQEWSAPASDKDAKPIKVAKFYTIAIDNGSLQPIPRSMSEVKERLSGYRPLSRAILKVSLDGTIEGVALSRTFERASSHANDHYYLDNPTNSPHFFKIVNGEMSSVSNDVFFEQVADPALTPRVSAKTHMQSEAINELVVKRQNIFTLDRLGMLKNAVREGKGKAQFEEIQATSELFKKFQPSEKVEEGVKSTTGKTAPATQPAATGESIDLNK